MREDSLESCLRMGGGGGRVGFCCGNWGFLVGAGGRRFAPRCSNNEGAGEVGLAGRALLIPWPKEGESINYLIHSLLFT